jgi:hypothetical protein
VLLAIAGRFQEIENTEESQRAADAALELARGIEDPRRRCETLAEAAVRLHKNGQSEAAAAVFDEAASAAGAITGNDVSRAYALLTLADKLHATGQNARAAGVLKTAEDLAFRVDDGDKEPLLAQLNKQRNKLP